MIQRIQSVYLFLAFVMGILIFFFPIASFVTENAYFDFFICHIKDTSPNPFPEMKTAAHQFPWFYTIPLAILQLIVSLLIVFTLFQYKKRPLQIKINYLTILLNVMLVGGIFYASSLIETQTGVVADYGFGGIFPLLSIVLVFLANSGVKKDEKLVRSADRLR